MFCALLLALLAQDSSDAARRFYDSAVKKQNADDHDGAIADATAALRLSPRYVFAYHVRAASRQAKGDLHGALADLTRAVEADPKFPWSYELRAGVHEALGDHAAAVADYTFAIVDLADASDAMTKAKYYFGRGRSKFALGDDAGALRDFDQANGQGSTLPWAHAWRAYVNYCAGRKDDADRDFERALAAEKPYKSSYALRARYKLRAREWNGVIADLDEKGGPEGAYEYALRGWAHAGRRAWAEAASDFQASISADPWAQDLAQLALWCVDARRGSADEAGKALKDYLKKRKSGPSNDFFAKCCAFAVGDLNDEATLRRLADGQPKGLVKASRCRAFFVIAMRRLVKKDTVGAAEALKKCLDTDCRESPEWAVAKAELDELENGK